MTQFILHELTHNEKKQLLQDSDWANDLNPIQVNTLAGYFKSYMMQTDQAIMQEGEYNKILCLLCEGSVDIVKENSAGKRKIIQTFGPGKIFGEVSFFDGAICSASVIAKSVIKLLVLHKEDFQTLTHQAPHIALTITLNVFKNLSQRLRQTTGKLIDFL